MPDWFEDNAPESDVVVSTRIRLARNLKDVPFPARITRKEDFEKVNTGAKGSILKSGAFGFTQLSEIGEIGIRALVERNIISSDLAKSAQGALITNNDESLSVMIMEEDHYRIQSLASGLALKRAFEEADRLDNMLSEGVEYAYDEELGFLTSCPTNAGTGLRASLMLHLPALTAAKGMQRIISMVGKIGMTVRGAFGEGSAASGAFYQISNQITLGMTEKEILTRLLSTAGKVIDFERATRKEMHRSLGVLLEDRVWRAVGILASARRMGDAEAQKLISDVAFGASLGIGPGLSASRLHALMMDTRPAVMAEKSGGMQPLQRDIARAAVLREVFKV